jgi:V/A-type H+/Na+-transporting ATPase subunit C
VAQFEYGNARLRVRKAALLGADDYARLVGVDVDELLGALSRTPYGPDVERVLPGLSGLRRLHAAIRTHLARVLREMRSFYAGGAGDLVELLLSRWDLLNLLTLVRGQASRMSAEDELDGIVPLGAFDDAAAGEVARQREFASAVQLLAAWRLPTPQLADALLNAWPAYERTGDLPALEAALTDAHGRRLDAALAAAGDDAAPLRDQVAVETDARNIVNALRLREALVEGELDEVTSELRRSAQLRGGRLGDAVLAAVARAPAPGDVVGVVGRDPAGERWLEPLGRWARGGDLVTLEDELDAAVTEHGVRLFERGDPLGVAIPVAYATAKENEARNLRLLGDAASRDADPAVTRSLLLVV